MTSVHTGVDAAGDQPIRRSTGLTSADAARRATAIAVRGYRVVVDLTDGRGNPSENIFHSFTTVTFTAQPGEPAFIDIDPGTSGALRSATLNNVAIDVDGYDPDQGLTLTGLAARNILEVEADCTYSHDGEGLYRFEERGTNEVYLYTQFETAAAKRVFACFDQPDMKASFDLTVVAPEPWTVVSNTAVADLQTTGNAKVWKFAPTARISTYLVALIAGPYAGWADTFIDESHTVEIPLRIFCRRSLQHYMDRDVKHLFDLTKRGFAFYHDCFGVTYPFGKYDQVFCPAYNAGAMENVAAVTITDDYVFRGQVTRYQQAKRAETMLHEMAHMWFGDLVTMKWWDDLWLNESFATWASNLCLAAATEFDDAWTTFAHVEKPRAYRQDALPTRHPVADAGVVNLDLVMANFDAITYVKGASVLKQLVVQVGLDRFREVLRDYFGAHAYANAEWQDLLAALRRKAAQPDLDVRMRQWLGTSGINTLAAEFEATAGVFTEFAVTQSGAEPGDGETRSHRVRIGVYDDDGAGKLTLAHPPVSVDVSGDRTEVPELRGVSRGKLILVNEHDDTYCALRLDPRSLETARTRVGDITDPLARAQIWSTLWEMTRDGALRPREFASLVTTTLHTEARAAVAQNLIAQAQHALTYYTQPGWANEHGWPEFADRLLELARGAVGGSAEQLVYLNGLGADRTKERQRSTVLSPRHTAVLAALLDTGAAADPRLAGLQLDDDLRWRLVIALAAAGVADADRLIAAQDRTDPTETGKLNVLQAKAARRSAASKDWAWHAVWHDADISNSDARALVAGFAAPGQAELLAPYTARYFESVVPMWNSRPEPVAATLAAGLYPLWDVSPDGIGAAGALLGRPDLPAGLRRQLAEGQADVRRALAARAVDAHP